MKEYALYKGDDFITLGTIKEISKETGIKEATLKWYTYPTYKKRLEQRKSTKNSNILIEIEEEED